MRITAAGAALVLLTYAVITTSAVQTTKKDKTARLEENLDVEIEEDEDERDEISTSLRVQNTTVERKSDDIRDIVSGVISRGSRSATSSKSALDKAQARVGATKIVIAGDEETDVKPEELPEPSELRYARPVKYRRRPFYSPPTRRSPVNRRYVYPDKSSRQPVRSGGASRRPASDPKRAPTESECTFFSKTVCLEAVDYPIEAIMLSMRNNKDMVAALLTDFKVQDAGFVEDDDFPQSSYKSGYDNRYDKRYLESRFETSNEIKRKYEFNTALDNIEEGFTCPSQVKYAQPQLARAASGVWKYIINTGEHTQTLRLEKCLNPRASCSFISDNYRSSCTQVYNYHRLLTWDSKLGLHMDIFKVPTCCTCHIYGYTDIYPPHQTDPPLKPKESFPGADFATSDHHIGKGSSHVNKYANSVDSAALNLFRDSYGNNQADQDETQLQHSSSSRRPSIARPPRPRKPSSVPRPFDKLPQQHAPNTRAPGYKGPRPHRPNRPFRRESAAPEIQDYPENAANLTVNRFSQVLDQDTLEPSLRLQNGGFDDEYQENSQRRINYNYHPIIDFFTKPEAAMLKSDEPNQANTAAASVHVDHDSWKPIFKP